MKLLRWLSIARKKIVDPYMKKNYAWRTVMVPEPTFEVPLPCILVSLSTGRRTKC